VSSHVELTAQLTAAGLVPAAWAATFAAVDRAAFVPDRCWVDDHRGELRPLDRENDPTAWASAVYSDQPIVTQLDDGRTTWPDTSRNVTSSASQPSMVLAMLDALNVADVHHVLEIGTGTGGNACLLARRVGDQQVTTIEFDPELADQARAALDVAGRKPTVVCGDGAEGYAPNAPYDRIISTASVLAGHVPIAWVAQTRVGGEILTPWKTSWGSGILVRLVCEGNRVAVGPVIGDAFFMNLRDHRTPFGHAGRFGRIAEEATEVPTTTTTVSPHEVAVDPDGAFTVGLHLSGVQHSVAYDDPDTYELLLYDVDTESWATVQVNPECVARGEFPVRQHGPRPLWTEVESAHAWWVAKGKPVRTRYGLTVTADSQTAWLDQPGNVVVAFL
jgi:protein-L-isoaspartate O-methyltransferase